jgi:hypothetical protein
MVHFLSRTARVEGQSSSAKGKTAYISGFVGHSLSLLTLNSAAGSQKQQWQIHKQTAMAVFTGLDI